MANLNLVTSDDPSLLTVNEDASFNSLLSDDVVMQWLMDLEADGLDSEGEPIAADSKKRLHA